MNETFMMSQKVKNTYRVNSILFSIKQIPIVKNIVPVALYKSGGLKIFAGIISILLELSNTFVTKPLYLIVFIMLPSMDNWIFRTDVFLHIFLFLTILGTAFNSHYFEASKHKYYAISLLRMDTRKYVISNYIYFCFKIFVGFLSTTVTLGLLFDINMFICILIPMLPVASKTIVNAIVLHVTNKSDNAYNEEKPTPKRWAFMIVCLILAYVPIFLGFTINATVLVVITLLTIILAIPAIIYLLKFENYTMFYKKLLSPSVVVFNLSDGMAVANKKAYSKQIEHLKVNTKNKKGYAYFHEIFVQRHRKLLARSAKSTMIVSIFVVLVSLVGVFISPDFSSQVNNFTLTFLPYCLFIMFFINRGQTIAVFMFGNCDSSMLSYSFYRQPSAVLALFTQRLKTIVGLNLLPASVIAIGLPLLLYFSGGTDNALNYLILFVSILAMSVFFSSHSLIVYYLLQPYNKESKLKSGTYSIVNTITAFAVFALMNAKIPTIWFGLVMIIFMVSYTSLAIFLAYKLAPKTFKLR